MSLPDLQNTTIRSFLNREEIILETVQQIMKDFGMFGLEITFSGTTDRAYEELLEQLSFQVQKLMGSNAELLMSVLYQVDISEREIMKAASEFPDYDQFEVIAHQIIFRDLKKVLFRRYFSSNNT